MYAIEHLLTYLNQTVTAGHLAVACSMHIAYWCSGGH